MYKYFIIFLIRSFYLFSVTPVLDFQLKDYENKNFINVLLDADSYITNFYCITDDGNVLSIKNMGESPIVNEIFSFDGSITQALTNDSLHFLSLSGVNASYMITTRDFISIDTVYESSNSILDFKIYDDRIAMLVSDDGQLSLVYSESTNNINLIERPITTQEKYNKIAMNMDQIILFKYLDNDLNLFRSFDDGKNWENKLFTHFAYQSIADIKTNDTLLYFLGKTEKNGNNVGSFDSSFNVVSAIPGLLKENTNLDLEFLRNFNPSKNPFANYQVGYSEVEDEGSFIYYWHFDKRYTFSYSRSLNKIKTNKKVDSLEFVAVGNNGLIVLVNQGLSPVEEDTDISKLNLFEVYPQIAKRGTEIYINSSKIINDLSIYDFSGRMLIEAKNINQRQFFQPIENLVTGIYFVKVHNQFQKFIVE